MNVITNLKVKIYSYGENSKSNRTGEHSPLCFSTIHIDIIEEFHRTEWKSIVPLKTHRLVQILMEEHYTKTVPLKVSIDHFRQLAYNCPQGAKAYKPCSVN